MKQATVISIILVLLSVVGVFAQGSNSTQCSTCSTRFFLSDLQKEYDSLLCIKTKLETALLFYNKSSTIYATRKKQYDKISSSLSLIKTEHDLLSSACNKREGPNCDGACTSSWLGSQCDIPACNGIPYNNPNVCSGRGICQLGSTLQNTCNCSALSSGDNCQTIVGPSVAGDSLNGRYYSDGTYAQSCKEYRYPSLPRVYSGEGSGFYLIKPNGSLTTIKVYCDMETDGGGWSFYYTTSGVVHLTTNTNNPINVTQNGYFADLRHLEFTDILYVRRSDMAKDWFTQSKTIKVARHIAKDANGIDYINVVGSDYNVFQGKGGADTSITYQLVVADNYGTFSEALMMSKYVLNTFKTANNFQSDVSSFFYRADTGVAGFGGVAFRENGSGACSVKLMSVAVR